MTAKTKIFFDVDGVFNALPRNPSELDAAGWSSESWKRERINGYMITWSTELVDRVNELSARDDVEVFWLTTWAHDAPKLIAPALGLIGADKWPVVGSRHDVTWDNRTLGASSLSAWWKFDLIQKVVDLDDNIVWIDDDLPYFYGAANIDVWHNRNMTARVLITPNDSTGISKSMMDSVFEFVDRVRADSSVV